MWYAPLLLLLSGYLKKEIMKEIEYIVVVQCHIVKERCSGYLCEYAFSERTGSFSKYPKDVQFVFFL